MARMASRWLALAAFVFVLWLARGVLAPFVVAGITAYVLTPLVDQLALRARVGRRLAGLVVFAAVVVAFGLGVWLLGARLVTEVRALGENSPSIAEAVTQRLTGGRTLSLLGQEYSPADLAQRLNQTAQNEIGDPGNALYAATLALEWGLQTLLALLALVYFLVDGHRLLGFVLRFVPADHRRQVHTVAGDIHATLGRYLQGQLVLIAVVTVALLIILEWAFKLPYALPIAVLSGVLEVIPLLGPFIAATVACLVGITQGGLPEAGWLALTYLIVRQVEDQLVMPMIVGRAIHVHPLVTIFAVVAGERIGGVLGALLAVPAAAAAKVILDYAYPPLTPHPARASGWEKLRRRAHSEP